MKQKPLFSLCHTTARLPDGWKPAAQAWLENCDHPEQFEYILCVPEAELEFGHWPANVNSHALPHRLITVPTRNGSVAGWNAAAAASTGSILIGVADDFYPCPHWDTEILKTLGENATMQMVRIEQEWVWDVDTGGDPHLLTHCILTRARYERFRYLHHPDYLGVVADDEFTVQSFRDGVVVNARHLKFEHRHPNYGTGAWDEVRKIEQSEESWKVGRKVFAEHFGKGRPIFSLCHTTARGPNEWEKAATIWIANAAHPQAIEYIICSDEGNPVSDFRPECGSFYRATNYMRKCAVDGWNCAAERSTGRFIITVADDWFPPLHWDLELLKVISDLQKEYAVWVATGGTPDLMTFSLLTRPYYERYGYVFFPEYLGMYADNDFTACALKDGVVVDARERIPVFPHFHPEYGTAPTDAVYEHQHRPEAFRVGESVFARRTASGFSLKPPLERTPAASASPIRRKVSVCLPHKDMEWLNGIFSVQNALKHLGFDFEATLGYTSGTTDITRLTITESVLKFHKDDQNTPYVLWIDDDNIVPPETVIRWFEFMDANPQADIIVGWCWIVRGGRWITSVGEFNDDGTVNFYDLKKVFESGREIREVSGLGSGFPSVLMRREVLEHLGPGSFHRIPNEHAPYGSMGEDFSFFWRAKEAGMRCYFDPMGKLAHLKNICQEPTMLLDKSAPADVKLMARQANGVPVEAPKEYQEMT